VCEKCREKAKEQGISKCRHNLDSVPHFIDEAKFDTIRAIFGSENEREFLIETQGLDPDEDDPMVFNPEKIKEFINRRVEPHSEIRFLFCTFDPNGGSDRVGMGKSEFALMVLSAPGNIFFGVEAIDAANPEDYQERVLTTIARILKLPYCSSAKLVVAVESGTGMEAGHINTMMRKRFGDDKVILMTDFTRKHGRAMNNKVKHDMAMLGREFLNSGDLAFHPNWVTSHKDPNKLLASLQAQLCSYSRKVKINRFAKNTEIYSGKGDNKQKRDDLAIAFQESLLARVDFFRHIKYSKYHSK